MSLIEPILVPPSAVRDTRMSGGEHPSPFPLSGSERLRVQFLRSDRLTPPDRRRWANLTACAAPGNVLAADWCLSPLLEEHPARLAVVCDRAGGWIGMLPIGYERLPGTGWLGGWHTWPLGAAHGHTGLIGTPLVRAGAEHAFWEALLAQLDARPGLAGGLFADALPLDDPATLALVSLCAQQGRALHGWGGFARSAWRPDIPAKPRAEMLMRSRMEEQEALLAVAHGPLKLAFHRHAEDCGPWLAAFHALERGGGSLGAAPFAPATLRSVIAAGQQRGAVRLASLAAGETIVAMAAWLVSDARGYGLALGIDARARGFAPHRMLMRRIAKHARHEGMVQFDACAAAGAVPDLMWPEQRRFARFAVAIGGPCRRALLARAMGALDSGASA